MTTDNTRHFGERIKTLYFAFHPEGYGAYVPWFYRMTEERAPLNVDLRTVYRWAKKGTVPPNKVIVVDDLICELAEEMTAKLQEQIYGLDDII